MPQSRETVSDASDESGVREPKPTRRPGVLIAEDDAAVLKFAETVLAARGYQVFAAQNMTDAVALFAAYDRDIDMLLTDTNMPGGDGPVLARELRARRPDLPVVFMSGRLDALLAGPLANELRKERPAALLPKPLSPTAIREAVKAAVRGTPA